VLRTSDLEYELPPGLIATQPVSPRDAARLMVVPRHNPAAIEHKSVRDLPSLLRAGDCLVFNTTRVLPARFHGRRAGTGGKIEGLFLHTLPMGGPGFRWVTLLRGRHLRIGAELELFDDSGGPCGITIRIAGRPESEPGAWIVESGHAAATTAVLERIGSTPLPPYIVKARQAAHLNAQDRTDRVVYQTIYAAEPGSVAAPTAGLHFTPELVGRLADMGVCNMAVVLHVGVGTFKPVETEFVEDHPMHPEWCSMSAGAVRLIREAKKEGRRIIAVGTTAARTLEAYAQALEAGGPVPASLETRILITPGYQFRWVDGLVTNFHLPRSTLLAMVGALLPGIASLKQTYATAIERGYRFYSFGDAMVIL
jgi:S-adenosylmethionine:tRNA ribosyltransferase-isomerase